LLTYDVNVTLAHSSKCSICENVDTHKVLIQELKCVWQNYDSPIRMNRTTNYGHVPYISITLEINQYTVQKCMYTV